MERVRVMGRGRKRGLVRALAAVAVGAVLLSGCGGTQEEDELAYRKIGISSLKAGDYEGAVAAFNSALKQHVGRITETEADICYYKATALYAGGDAEGAVEVCDALIEYDRKNADAYYLRGCILLETGEEDAALSDFESAVKYNADDLELYIGIYENLSAHQLSDQGEDYLNRAFDVKGDSAEQLALRGRIYYLLGEYDNAVTELLSAKEKESAMADLYLAQVYEAMGDLERAASCYQEYASSEDADPAVFASLAGMEMERGEYQAALNYIDQGLSMEGADQKGLMRNKIICLEYLGDFEGAWAVMQEYTALYPEDEEAQRESVFLQYRQEDAGEEDTETASTGEGSGETGGNAGDTESDAP